MPEIGDIKKRFEIGLKGNHKVYWASCPDCGKEKWAGKANALCASCRGIRGNGSQNFKFWNESKHRDDCRCWRCHTSFQTGEKNHSWKGGRTVSGGYIAIRIYQDDPMFEMTDSDGRVFEHRLVMARKLGRPLKRGETVHHKDGNRKNNNIENLELWFTNHSHGVRISDVINDYAVLYGYHCPSCDCDKE